MLMRKRPIRGEKYVTTEGVPVTVLEPAGEAMVKVVLENGKLTSIAKSYMNLPVIDTKCYEKL